MQFVVEYLFAVHILVPAFMCHDCWLTMQESNHGRNESLNYLKLNLKHEMVQTVYALCFVGIKRPLSELHAAWALFSSKKSTNWRAPSSRILEKGDKWKMKEFNEFVKLNEFN